MYIKVSKSQNSTSLYIAKSFRKNGKSTSKIVEKLGTIEEVRLKAGTQDPYEWANKRAKELTLNEKKKEPEIMVKFSPSKLIKPNQETSFNGGYLFLQGLYHQLKLDKVCEKITKSHSFDYDLNGILQQLLFSRILFPGSKRDNFNKLNRYIEQPDIKLHQIYRALEVLSENNDFIQAELYKNSRSVIERNSKVLYYDCTNFFFEIEEANGDKQYGKSKENKPNPIVQMGLFMDGNGIPLAFDMTSGNTNEQTTLRPLETKILKDFGMSKLVVCTDAGLSSNANKKFNNIGGRAFITTQSIKKAKKMIQDWALSDEGWRNTNHSDKKLYQLSELDEKAHMNTTFYKERWFKEDNQVEQRMIVSFSPKYKAYQRKIRDRQIEKAEKDISNGKKPRKKVNVHDHRRFIEHLNITKDGELADLDYLTLNHERIRNEEAYDGFYAVTTNLEDSVNSIVKVNHNRWEIEETFRIMKSEFKARPVHLSRDDRIKAHFLTCFMAMTIFRILEKKLSEKFSYCEIINTLKEMNFHQIPGDGYIPTYTRNDLTDALHEFLGVRTDTQIVTNKKMKKILKHVTFGKR